MASRLYCRASGIATSVLAGLLLSTSLAAAEDKAAILLPGSINDQSWNSLGYSILMALKPHGFATAYSENVSDADEAEALRGYAGQGYTVVMGHSGRFVSAMEQIAPDFPKTQFIAVSGNEGVAPNVMSIDWNNAQFGCQLGLLAARMSRTKACRLSPPRPAASASAPPRPARKSRSSTSRTWRIPRPLRKPRSR